MEYSCDSVTPFNGAWFCGTPNRKVLQFCDHRPVHLPYSQSYWLFWATQHRHLNKLCCVNCDEIQSRKNDLLDRICSIYYRGVWGFSPCTPKKKMGSKMGLPTTCTFTFACEINILPLPPISAWYFIWMAWADYRFLPSRHEGTIEYVGGDSLYIKKNHPQIKYPKGWFLLWNVLEVLQNSDVPPNRLSPLQIS